MEEIREIYCAVIRQLRPPSKLRSVIVRVDRSSFTNGSESKHPCLLNDVVNTTGRAATGPRLPDRAKLNWVPAAKELRSSA